MEPGGPTGTPPPPDDDDDDDHSDEGDQRPEPVQTHVQTQGSRLVTSDLGASEV